MLPISRVIGHKEWAPGRKSDPTYDMNWRRAGVAGIVPRGSAAPQTPAPKPVPRVLEDDVMYMKCELNGPGKGTSIALAIGPFFIGLAGGEFVDAERAIKEGAPYQWIGPATWAELDKRSHAICDNPRPVRVITEEPPAAEA